MLYALGLEEELHRVACAPGCFATFDWSARQARHRRAVSSTFKSHGAPYLTAHRAGLRTLLLDGASGARIHTGNDAETTSHGHGAVARC